MFIGDSTRRNKFSKIFLVIFFRIRHIICGENQVCRRPEEILVAGSCSIKKSGKYPGLQIYLPANWFMIISRSCVELLYSSWALFLYLIVCKANTSQYLSFVFLADTNLPKFPCYSLISNVNIKVKLNKFNEVQITRVNNFYMILIIFIRLFLSSCDTFSNSFVKFILKIFLSEIFFSHVTCDMWNIPALISKHIVFLVVGPGYST